MRKLQDQERTVQKWSVALVLAAVVLWARVEGQQRDKEPARGRHDDFVQGELLIKFSSSLGRAQREAILSTKRITRLRRFEAVDIDLVRVPPGLAVAAAAGGLRSLSGVVMVQPNYMRHAIQSAPPSDPFWLEGRLWGLDKIQAQGAWNRYSRGDGSVVVASLDTGVNYTHPDLAANMWRNPLEVAGNGLDDDGNGYVDDVFGIDARNHSGNPYDEHGHGTLTAGVIAGVGDNDLGVVGVNWNAKILACKFLGTDGTGTDAGAIECFNYIVNLRKRGVNIRVSSNGWGDGRSDEAPAGALRAAIDAAGDAGILNVFGAGNDGKNTDGAPFDPASFRLPSIVSVASSGRFDERSGFSNYGRETVDLAAPGEDIFSTHLAAYGFASGTSMAAAHVAGAAALLSAIDPSMPVDKIKAILLKTVDQSSDWTDRVASGGRLNLSRAAAAMGVDPNRPPTVSILSQGIAAALTTPVNVNIEADASDTDGTVEEVTFYANGAPIGTVTASPFRVPWSPAVGDYVLTAVATDNLGATTTSAGVSVTVSVPNVPPSVSLTSPVAGTSFVAPTTIPISATAADTDGTVSLVTFYANGVPIGSATASPFTVPWTPEVGDYVLTAIAADNLGGTTTSAGVSVTVIAPNVPLSVSLTSPFAGTSFVAPATIPITAMAADSDGTVSRVTFYANGSPIGSDTASPFGISWGPVAPGQYLLTAIAIDNRDGTATSASVAIVVVAPNVPPSVTLTAPVTGSSFAAPVSLTITASATDTDGSVASVAFFVNGQPMGAALSSPFSVPWNNVLPGSYTLTAVATDNSGATSPSNAVLVTVTAPVRMNVALAANGGLASGSSTFTANYPASGANNGDRRGINWGSGGGWNDGTLNTSPDWLVIDFNGSKMIDEVNVFSLQDAYTAPVDPTPTMTFTLWGLRAFEIQYWNGSDWAPIPGAAVTNNNLVWRRFTFTPVTTTRIRLFITAALNGSSRVIEVEAWGTAAFGSPAEAADLLPRGLDPAWIDAPDSGRRRRDP
jgi:subtilisin family serine protease